MTEKQAKQVAQEKANATGRTHYVIAWWDEESQYYSYSVNEAVPVIDPTVVNEEFEVVPVEPQPQKA